MNPLPSAGRSKIAEVIERLEKATDGSRELDAEIALIAGLPQAFFGSKFGTDYVDGPESHFDAATWSGMGRVFNAPAFTASIDAAVSLAETLLPGWAIKLVFEGGYRCAVLNSSGKLSTVAPTFVASGKFAAIALCICVLSALRAKEGTPHE